MGKFANILTVAVLIFLHPLSARTMDFSLNGLYFKVEACSEEIFRIRISPRSDFDESMMERYGILNVGNCCSAHLSEDESNLVLSTESANLRVDRTTGEIEILDANGNILVGGISFHAPSSAQCVRMADIINEKYASLVVRRNGGIIGDDDGSLSEKDKTEGGDPAKSCIVSIKVRDDERFYGGGSTSREHIQHRGEILRMWATYQLTEIPMPFLMSSDGWGIYLNSTRKSYFDVACTQKDSLNIYNTSDEADFFIMLGNGMPNILNHYTRLTGRNYLLPKWAYGLCFGPNMKEDQWDILNDAARFRETGVPCDVMWLEPQWMDKHYDFSTSKKWNYDKFTPEYFFRQNKYPKTYYPSLFIGRLNDMGYHLGLWVCEEYDLSITEEDEIAASLGLPQSGQEHWMDHLTTFIDMGVEGFKLDPARTLDEHTYRKYHNGRQDKEMHNLNQVLLPKQLSSMYRKHTGKRGWCHYCAGWSGTQHWGASTSGDNGGGKVALFDQLNLGNSGYMNTSCDVMFVPRDEMMQSLHFGTFLPWIQINSWCSMFHPFYFNKKDMEIYRKCILLRYSLLPYIYSCAIEGTETGMPIVRSMPLVFPDDRRVDDMSTQYMFGPSLCIGIFTDEIYLPEGKWFDGWTGECVKSTGKFFRIPYPEDRAGVMMIRGGAIVPMMDPVPFIGRKPLDKLTLHIYPDGESRYIMYDCDAESYGYEQGRISSTLFQCCQKDNIIEIVVNPSEGEYENMPSKKNYVFKVASSKKPSKVTLNGKKDSRCWTHEDGFIVIDAGSHPVSESLTVKIY